MSDKVPKITVLWRIILIIVPQVFIISTSNDEIIELLQVFLASLAQNYRGKGRILLPLAWIFGTLCRFAG